MAITYIQGVAGDGATFDKQFINSPSDWTTSGAAVFAATAGIVINNFSGISVIVPQSGIQHFEAWDGAGTAAGAGSTVIISGNGATFNGSIKYSLSTNYGQAVATLISGTSTYAVSKRT